MLVGRLPEKYRAPLVLYYMEDMAYKEIANILAVPMGTVQSRISRGKALLYRMLMTEEDGKEASHG